MTAHPADTLCCDNIASTSFQPNDVATTLSQHWVPAGDYSAKRLEYLCVRPKQRCILQKVLVGQSCMFVALTGSGKSYNVSREQRAAVLD